MIELIPLLIIVSGILKHKTYSDNSIFSMKKHLVCFLVCYNMETQIQFKRYQSMSTDRAAPDETWITTQPSEFNIILLYNQRQGTATIDFHKRRKTPESLRKSINPETVDVNSEIQAKKWAENKLSSEFMRVLGNEYNINIVFDDTIQNRGAP